MLENNQMHHGLSPDDLAFIDSLETLEVAPDDFDHRAHLRMAYVYLCEHDPEAASSKVRASLCALLSHNGIDLTSKYHETMTQAWVLAVAHFMAETPAANSASEFIAANPILLDRGIMATHYSKPTLFSDEARSSFVEPDLTPIPRHDDGFASITSSESKK